VDFKIKIQKRWISSITFIINYRRLNIKIIKIDSIPGPLPIDEPDTEVTLQLLSEDLGEVFFLGFYLSQEKPTVNF